MPPPPTAPPFWDFSNDSDNQRSSITWTGETEIHQNRMGRTRSWLVRRLLGVRPGDQYVVFVVKAD